MVAITVTGRVDSFPVPGTEFIKATPTNTQTYTSRLGVVDGVFIGWSEAAAAADSISYVVSSNNVITFTVIGTARSCDILIVGHG